MYRINATRPPDTRQTATTATPSPPPTAITPDLALDHDLLRTDATVLVVQYRVKQVDDEERAEECSQNCAGQRAARVLP